MFHQVFTFKFHFWSSCVRADGRVNPPPLPRHTPPLLTSPILFLPSKASDHGPLPAEGGGPPWGPAVSVMAHLCGRAPATADG